MSRAIGVGGAFLACFLVSTAARADFHLMHLSEVMGHADGDVRIQFFEFQMEFADQHLVGGHTVVFFDAAGNETGTFVIPGNVDQNEMGDAILFGTQAFADLADPDPDFIIPDGLLHPYAGRICFEEIDCVAYGNYTGDNSLYGTPAAGFPLTGTASLVRVRTAFPKNNSTDFALQAPTPTRDEQAVAFTPPARECFITDNFPDLGKWDDPADNAGLDFTNCGTPAVVDVGLVDAGGGRLLLTPGMVDVGLGAPVVFTGPKNSVALGIADPNYRMRFQMLAQPGIATGAAFTRQRYLFDEVEHTFDLSTGAGFGINFSFDDTGEISDHLHADARLACFSTGSVDEPDSVDYPGFTLKSDILYTVVLDVDGDDEAGPLVLQVKLFNAAGPEPLLPLIAFRKPDGLGPLTGEDFVHGALIAALGSPAAALEVSDFSICEIPRNQKHVRFLTCLRQETGIVLLTWENPPDAETGAPIAIAVNGQTVDTLSGAEITYELADPPPGDLEITVTNYSGTPVPCSVCENTPPVPLIDGPASVPSGTPLVMLDSSASVDGDDGSQALSRFWEVISAPPGGTTSIQDPGAVIANVSVNADGPYRVRLTLTDAGCPGSVGLTEVAEHAFTVGTPPGGVQKPGDENQDGSFNISDPISVLNHLFAGTNPTLPCGDGTGADPANLALLDLNGDGGINISDPVYGLNFLFGGGPGPRQGVNCRPIDGCPELPNPCTG